MKTPWMQTQPGIWRRILGGGDAGGDRMYSSRALLANAAAVQGDYQYRQWREWATHRRPRARRTDEMATEPTSTGDDTTQMRRMRPQPPRQPQRRRSTPQPTPPEREGGGNVPQRTTATRRPRCQPERWRKTLADRMPELWNDPGAREALHSITTTVPPHHKHEWHRTKFPPCNTTRTHVGPGQRYCTQRCRCKQLDRKTRDVWRQPEDDDVWKGLMIARDTLIWSERADWRNAEEEEKATREWERWAARWHATWTVRVKGPPRRQGSQRVTSKEQKLIIHYGMQLLNALRARNAFRWLMTRVAQGRHEKDHSVAAEQWKRVFWAAHVLEGSADPEQTQRYVPPETRGMLNGTRICRPTWGGRDCAGREHRNTAWIYALSSIRSRRTYIGATDRKQSKVDGRNPPTGSQSPGLRHAEHIRRGWWIARGYNRPDAQDRMPMYTMAQRWAHGMSELVMTPVVAITMNGVNSDSRRRTTPLAQATLRTRMLSLEAALQRKWRPTLVCPWADADRRVRVRSMQRDACQAGRATGSENGEIPHLVYTRTRTKWNPRTDWRAQYGKGVLALSDGGSPWPDAVCDAIMTRLLNHGKQATSLYRILRRADTHNLTRLWTWAAQGGRAKETRVWAHLEKALHGRTSGIRKARVCIKDLRNGNTNSARYLQQAWAVSQTTLGEMRDTFMTRQTHHPRVSELVRTDRAWQGRLSPFTVCQCDRFKQWVQQKWGIMEPMMEHRGHVWATLDWLLQQIPRTRDGGNESDLRRWVLAMTQDRENGTKVPMTAIQTAAPTDTQIMIEAVDGIAKIVTRECESRGTRVTAPRIRMFKNVVRQVMAHWHQAAAAQPETGREELRTLTARDVRKYLRIPWLVTAPLDKGRHRVRIVCPVTAWRELEEAAKPYVEWGPWMHTPEATVRLTQWRDMTDRTHNKWRRCGWPAVPDTMQPAEARTAAKSKAPVEKFRLIERHANQGPRSDWGWSV